MGWAERVKTAMFADGGVLGCCLCVSKNNPPTADLVEPAAELLISPGNRTEAAASTAVAPELTLLELNKATDSFSAARLMSHEAGGNWYDATVYRATLRRAAQPPSPRGSERRPPAAGAPFDDAFLRLQVSLLSTLRHDNLVRLLGYAIAPDLRVLLFEFATVGTLHDVLHGPKGEPRPGSSRPAVTLSWAQRTRIALDAARGLQYLHEVAAVSHWGIRSTNVLLFEGLRAKIVAEFNVFDQPAMEELARDMAAAEHPWSRICYLPPEYIQSGHRIAYKTDVYSFGVVLLELLTGRKPDHVTPDSRTLVQWATPMLRKGRVKRCIDPKLGSQYPSAGALNLGRIALQCSNHCRSRPSMAAVAQMISNIVGD
ncbi:unnamed protein product [Urochloa humidicola]